MRCFAVSSLNSDVAESEDLSEMGNFSFSTITWRSKKASLPRASFTMFHISIADVVSKYCIILIFRIIVLHYQSKMFQFSRLGNPWNNNRT